MHTALAKFYYLLNTNVDMVNLGVRCTMVKSSKNFFATLHSAIHASTLRKALKVFHRIVFPVYAVI